MMYVIELHCKVKFHINMYIQYKYIYINLQLAQERKYEQSFLNDAKLNPLLKLLSTASNHGHCIDFFFPLLISG